MDFLVLFLFYLVFLLISVVVICIFTKNQRLKSLVLEGAQVCSGVIPQCLQRAGRRLLHQLFHTRNPAFIVLHLLLQGLVYAEYTLEIFGYCQELEFSLPYLLLPYLLLGINLLFFTLTCSANPGTINKTNESLLLQVYEFDNVMFPENSRCSTCDLWKPARSKHCSKCGCWGSAALPPDTPASTQEDAAEEAHTKLRVYSPRFPTAEPRTKACSFTQPH